MIYQITIPKIHCSGCVNLIKMSLEEIFNTVSVDQYSKIAEFQSDESIEMVKESLNKLFEELRESGYEYSNLMQKI